MPNNLHAMSTLEVTQIVWDTFAELARSERALDSKEYFSLEGFSGDFATPTSVFERAFNKWKPPKSQTYIPR
jgi:hypothetical protein